MCPCPCQQPTRRPPHGWAIAPQRKRLGSPPAASLRSSSCRPGCMPRPTVRAGRRNRAAHPCRGFTTSPTRPGPDAEGTDFRMRIPDSAGALTAKRPDRGIPTACMRTGPWTQVRSDSDLASDFARVPMSGGRSPTGIVSGGMNPAAAFLCFQRLTAGVMASVDAADTSVCATHFYLPA